MGQNYYDMLQSVKLLILRRCQKVSKRLLCGLRGSVAGLWLYFEGESPCPCYYPVTKRETENNKLSLAGGLMISPDIVSSELDIWTFPPDHPDDDNNKRWRWCNPPPHPDYLSSPGPWLMQVPGMRPVVVDDRSPDIPLIISIWQLRLCGCVISIPTLD